MPFGARANGINDAGVVVGVFNFDYEDPFPNRGFIYRDGQSVDLSTLADGGWTIFEANAINDAGQIVGTGSSGGQSGFRRPVLLTPVPEPASFAALALPCLLLKRRRVST
jgi:probable HAF family extracellular repeat protein